MEVQVQTVSRDGRFHVLIAEDRAYAGEHWTSQLPRLLEPQGVVSYVVRSGRQAMDVATRMEVHAAVIDMATPLDEAQQTPRAGEPAEMWLLDLFRRLPNRPPVVIVHATDYSQRKFDRVLHQALKLGAFSVLNKPVELETILSVFQRLLERQYGGTWPRRPETN